MRFLSAVAALAVALAAPVQGQAAAKTTYQITFGTIDLGTWTTLKMATQAGTYTATAFDSSHGPGFKALTFTRPYVDAADNDLFKKLGAPDLELTVHVLADGTLTHVLSCNPSRVFSVGTEGDPGKGTDNISFACMSVREGNAP